MILAREVEIAKLFQHVNILKLKEYYDSCEESTFVYELIPDGELFDYLAKLRKISELETCGIIWQVLQGISCMHEKGIVHRDLKLENLLCSKQEKFVPFRIVIADFGFSKNFKSSILKTACGTLDCKHKQKRVSFDSKNTFFLIIHRCCSRIAACRNLY